MKTEVVDLPITRVAYVRHRGPYHEIGSAFSVLGQKAGPMGLFALPGAVGIAVYSDDPETTPAEDLTSMAGIVVPEGAHIGDLEEAHLDSGRFLKAEYTGPYSGLGNAWGVVCSQLIPESGLQFGKGPSFEMYLNDCNTTPPEHLRTDIYVPVA